MPPQQSPQYDFILDPNTPKRSGPAFLQNPKQRKIIIGLFLATVLTLVFVVGNLLLGGGGKSNNDLATLAAHQTEISRVAALGLEQAKGSETRVLASNIQAIMTSDLQNTVSYLSRNGTKLNEKQLAAKLDNKTTENLQNATQRNDYDDVLLSALDQLIANYKRDLQLSLDTVESPNKKAVVETAAQNIITLTTE